MDPTAAKPSDFPTARQVKTSSGPPTIDAIAPHFPQLEILDVLGFGGMGVVYKAKQRSLDRIVALKVLPPRSDRHPSFAERFTREARALARLQHPNIVSIYDSGQAGDLYYFIMEFVDGSNLRQKLGAHDGRLEAKDAIAIVPCLCDALEYAHEEGVAHRDIKPENILVDRKGRVKIADFGIAKLLQKPDCAPDFTLTHTQQIIGTMHYMAPEQIEKPASVDHRADIYSLGVVMYEMMTGELPIGRFPMPSERATVDPRLDIVVLRALEKEPSRRYQRASEIKTDLQSLAGPAGAGMPALPAYATHAPGSVFASRAGPATPAPSQFTYTPAPGAASPSNPFAGLANERNIGVAYLCWIACFFALFGIHRFYCGKWITGLIWFFTLGCLFIGQGIDLLLIPRMVRKSNALQRPWLPGGVPNEGHRR